MNIFPVRLCEDVLLSHGTSQMVSSVSDYFQFTDIDDCHGEPCVHGACVDGVANFTCQCEAGWTADRCHEGELYSAS